VPDPIPPSVPPSPKDDRDFFQIVKVGTGLAMGSMAAFLYSLKQVHPAIQLKFTLGTVVIFFLVGAFSWKFCGVLAKSVNEREGPEKKRFIVRWLIFFVTLSSLGTIAAFIYALKDVSGESRRDVIEGTLIAVFVLAIGGWLIYKAFRFFEEQSEIELENQRDEHERERARENGDEE
jgi:hypothetical protein